MSRSFGILLLVELRPLLTGIVVVGRSHPGRLASVMIHVVCSTQVIFAPLPTSGQSSLRILERTETGFVVSSRGGSAAVYSGRWCNWLMGALARHIGRSGIAGRPVWGKRGRGLRSSRAMSAVGRGAGGIRTRARRSAIVRDRGPQVGGKI